MEANALDTKKSDFGKFWWVKEPSLLKVSTIFCFNYWAAVWKSRFGTEFDNMKQPN